MLNIVYFSGNDQHNEKVLQKLKSNKIDFPIFFAEKSKFQRFENPEHFDSLEIGELIIYRKKKRRVSRFEKTDDESWVLDISLNGIIYTLHITTREENSHPTIRLGNTSIYLTAQLENFVTKVHIYLGDDSQSRKTIEYHYSGNSSCEPGESVRLSELEDTNSASNVAEIESIYAIEKYLKYVQNKHGGKCQCKSEFCKGNCSCFKSYARCGEKCYNQNCDNRPKTEQQSSNIKLELVPKDAIMEKVTKFFTNPDDSLEIPIFIVKRSKIDDLAHPTNFNALVLDEFIIFIWKKIQTKIRRDDDNALTQINLDFRGFKCTVHVTKLSSKSHNDISKCFKIKGETKNQNNVTCSRNIIDENSLTKEIENTNISPTSTFNSSQFTNEADQIENADTPTSNTFNILCFANKDIRRVLMEVEKLENEEKMLDYIRDFITKLEKRKKKENKRDENIRLFLTKLKHEIEKNKKKKIEKNVVTIFKELIRIKETETIKVLVNQFQISKIKAHVFIVEKSMFQKFRYPAYFHFVTFRGIIIFARREIRMKIRPEECDNEAWVDLNLIGFQCTLHLVEQKKKSYKYSSILLDDVSIDFGIEAKSDNSNHSVLTYFINNFTCKKTACEYSDSITWNGSNAERPKSTLEDINSKLDEREDDLPKTITDFLNVCSHCDCKKKCKTKSCPCRKKYSLCNEKCCNGKCCKTGCQNRSQIRLNELESSYFNTIDQIRLSNRTSQKYLSVVSSNIVSHDKYMGELQNILEKAQFQTSFLLLTEVLQKDSNFQIPGYSCYFIAGCNEKNNMIFCCHEDFKVTVYPLNMETTVAIRCDIESNDYQCSIICFYKTPKSSEENFVDELQELFNRDEVKNLKFCIVTGDMNLDTWHENGLELDNQNLRYLNMMTELKFQNLITKPTREKMVANTPQKSCIDHMFVRGLTCYENAIIKTDLTDHFTIVGLFELDPNQIATNSLIKKEKASEEDSTKCNSGDQRPSMMTGMEWRACKTDKFLFLFET